MHTLKTRSSDGNGAEKVRLLRGGGVLPMSDHSGYIGQGFVLLRGNRIVNVGPIENAPRDDEVDEVLDTSGCVVTPGLINMHQHHWYCLLKGASPGLYLEDWVKTVLLPACRALQPRDYLVSMKLAAAEMLLSGTTSFFNHSVFETSIELVRDLAETSRQTGIRQFFGKELRANASQGIQQHRAEVEEALQEYPHGLGDRFCVDLVVESGEHWLATGSMNAELASYAAELAEKYHIYISDHITGGTGFRSVKDFRLREGSGEVLWLLKHGLLSDRSLLIHSVWIDEGEIRAIADCGASVVVCPSSEAFTAGGVPPLRALLDAGVNVALGSDGPMVNDAVDMLSQMRECFLLANAKYLTPAVISASELWWMATRAGAKALGFEGKLGQLSPNALADIAVFDLSDPRYGGAIDPVTNLILCGGGGRVKWLFIDGQMVVNPDGVVTFDVADTCAEARELAPELVSRSGIPLRIGSTLH